MEFSFTTDYNQKAVTAMAKALRKTVRKKQSRRSHILGWIVILMAVLFTVPQKGMPFSIDFKTIVTWVAALCIFIVFLFEDSLNGYLARKKMLAGSEHAASYFSEEGYRSVTAVGETLFHYENIALVAETKEYYIFLLDARYAQVYDKASLTGGTQEEFRRFLCEQTEKQILSVS